MNIQEALIQLSTEEALTEAGRMDASRVLGVLKRALDAPWRVVVIGGKAGKSTLINAVLGEDRLKTGLSDCTQEVQEVLGEGWPLGGIILVDTPGLEQEGAEALVRKLDMDAALFVSDLQQAMPLNLLQWMAQSPAAAGVVLSRRDRAEAGASSPEEVEEAIAETRSKVQALRPEVPVVAVSARRALKREQDIQEALQPLWEGLVAQSARVEQRRMERTLKQEGTALLESIQAAIQRCSGPLPEADTVLEARVQGWATKAGVALQKELELAFQNSFQEQRLAVVGELAGLRGAAALEDWANAIGPRLAAFSEQEFLKLRAEARSRVGANAHKLALNALGNLMEVEEASGGLVVQHWKERIPIDTTALTESVDKTVRSLGIGGAAAGAIVGTVIAPGVGTVLGGALGALAGLAQGESFAKRALGEAIADWVKRCERLMAPELEALPEACSRAALAVLKQQLKSPSWKLSREEAFRVARRNQQRKERLEQARSALSPGQ